MPYQTRSRKPRPQQDCPSDDVSPCLYSDDDHPSETTSVSSPVQNPSLSPAQELSQPNSSQSTSVLSQRNKKKKRLDASSSEEDDLSFDESSQSPKNDDGQSSMDERRRKRKCTMVVDKDECICYPATGNIVQILAMNGTISMDGTTLDGGFVFKFEDKNGRMFRKKLFTPDLGDSKALIKKINAHAENSGIKWLYLRDLDVGDKRANMKCLRNTHHFQQKTDSRFPVPAILAFLFMKTGSCSWSVKKFSMI